MVKTEDNSNKLVALRYSNALLEIVNDKNISKEDVLSELKSILEYLNLSNDLRIVMKSPVISSIKKKEILVNLFKNNINNFLMNFVLLLVDKNRFDLLSDIYQEYVNSLNSLNNKLNMFVTSAIDLTNDQKDSIKSKISDILKKDIELDWSVNKDIIAGLVFEANDCIVDLSLRHKIQDLSRNIKR